MTNEKDFDNSIKYEEAFSRLEQIVSKLESGDVSLDDSISLFEEGTRLASLCSQKLKTAQQKITVLKKENNND